MGEAKRKRIKSLQEIQMPEQEEKGPATVQSTATRDRLQMVVRNMEVSLASAKACLEFMKAHPEMDGDIALTFGIKN